MCVERIVTTPSSTNTCATCAHSCGENGSVWPFYRPASQQEIIRRLDNHLFEPQRREMKVFLVHRYLYDYDSRRKIPHVIQW